MDIILFRQQATEFSRLAFFITNQAGVGGDNLLNHLIKEGEQILSVHPDRFWPLGVAEAAGIRERIRTTMRALQTLKSARS